MYAIVEIKGKQYKIEQGDDILVEYLGDENILNSSDVNTLLIKKDDNTVLVGTPYVSEAKITCKVLEVVKGDKVIVGKHKRRKDYKRKVGHRQKYHKVNIENIAV